MTSTAAACKRRGQPDQNLIHDPNLFHINRHSLSAGVFVGLFIAFLPIPGQVLVAAFMAWKLRCNLPIAVGSSAKSHYS